MEIPRVSRALRFASSLSYSVRIPLMSCMKVTGGIFIRFSMCSTDTELFIAESCFQYLKCLSQMFSSDQSPSFASYALPLNSPFKWLIMSLFGLSVIEYIDA